MPFNNHNLPALREALLNLHKALLEYQKRGYEASHQKIQSAGKYFELVTSHRDFMWLKTLSELIVSLDILMEGKTEAGETSQDVVVYIEKLLSSVEPRNDFGEKYRAAIKADPAVTMAHASVSSLLKRGG